MNFSNAHYIPMPAPRHEPKMVRSPALSLSSPMIDRVYKAKPGCSACGKKIA